MTWPLHPTRVEEASKWVTEWAEEGGREPLVELLVRFAIHEIAVWRRDYDGDNNPRQGREMVQPPNPAACTHGDGPRPCGMCYEPAE